MGKPQHMQHSPCTKSTLAGRRPYWTAEEDAQLVRLVKKYGTKNWGLIAKELHSPIQRKGKSCRSRWMHQLNPCIKHEPFSVEEERLLIAKQREFGNKWSRIAAFLPGRTDNAIKNHWHGHVKRRLMTAATVVPFSSDEEEMDEVEMKRRRNDAFPVPLLRNQREGTVMRGAQQEMDCARALLQLAQTQRTPLSAHVTSKINSAPDDEMRLALHQFSTGVEVKRELMSEEDEADSESSREPNNVFSSPLAPMPGALHHAPAVKEEHMHEENNNTAEMIQPHQQRILSETLESAGLGHYPVLPLCPIKEEDIDTKQHVVIVLQQQQQQQLCEDVPMEDSCSGVCLFSENRECEGGDMATSLSLGDEFGGGGGGGGASSSSSMMRMFGCFREEDTMPRPRREIKKPIRFLEVAQKLE